MSLSALIDKLGTLVSKAYLFSAFIPILVFAFLNASLLWFHSIRFHMWAANQMASVSGFLAATIAVGLAVAAYILLSVSTFLRESLEGKWLPVPLRSYLIVGQRKQLDDLWSRYSSARNDRFSTAESIPKWRSKLIDSAVDGINKHEGQNTYGKDLSAAKRVQSLRENLAAGKTVSFGDLNGTVEEMVAALCANDESVNSREDKQAARSELRADRFDLVVLLDRALGVLASEEQRLLNERQNRFGLVAEPTAMGNIAASVHAFAMIRYSMNLTAFWSRLQPGLQADANFYGVLQDSKFQLDFLIACAWLTAFTWIGWTAALLFLPTSLAVWLLVTFGGPLVTIFFYRLAVTSYTAFADLMRTSVDLFRFSVLRAMHIPLPAGTRQERRVWQSLEKLTVLGEEGVDLTYAADAPRATP